MCADLPPQTPMSTSRLDKIHGVVPGRSLAMMCRDLTVGAVCPHSGGGSRGPTLSLSFNI